MTRPTRLRKALDLFREAHANARRDLAEATVAVLALTETGCAGHVASRVETRAAELGKAERDVVEAQAELDGATDVLERLSSTPDLRDWGGVEVKHPAWATQILRELGRVTNARVYCQREIGVLLLELRGSDVSPRNPTSWAAKEKAKDSAEYRVRWGKYDRLTKPSSKRLWWSCIAVGCGVIVLSAQGLASQYSGSSFANAAAFTASLAGLACLVAVILFLLNPRICTGARRLARLSQSLLALNARIRTLTRLKDALHREELLGAQRMALLAELGPRRQELLEELASNRGILTLQLEGSSQLMRQNREDLEAALETHERSTARLGLEAATEFRSVVAELQARYVRYNHAFAAFPSLTSRSYVPPRRAKTGELTRIAEGDMVWSKGGFLAQASDVSRRLVRKSGLGEASDVGAILDYPSDQIDAFELCLYESVNGPVAA